MIALHPRVRLAVCLSTLWLAGANAALAAQLSVVEVGSTKQVVGHTKLITDALRTGDETLGRLLQERFRLATASKKPQQVVERLQRSLDPICLLSVGINPESRVKVAPGPAKLELTKDSWRYFLVKVVNEAGVTAPLRFTSNQQITETDSKSRDRWLEIETYQGGLLPAELSGAKVEYQIIRLRAHETGKRAAVIAADVGQGTADIGFRNDVLLTFTCKELISETLQATLLEPRRPTSGEDLRYWLQNMVWHHQYEVPDIQAATGLSLKEIRQALKRFDISPAKKPEFDNSKLRLLPYPGGKHPRIGFLEGAIRPQRETKASVFLPWDPSSYVVLDVPEAIWSNLGLTYLAHEHIPTVWDYKGKHLAPMEWIRSEDGTLECERRLPNGIVFGVRLEPQEKAIRMEMWLENGTSEPLSDLRVQNCVLLKFAKGFQSQQNDNKVFWGPYAACQNTEGDKWIISAWDPIHRSWGNADCPCLHSDPKFPDCPPGETKRLTGWFSFYEGTNIYRELQRIEKTGWRLDLVNDSGECSVQGIVVDATTSLPIPARVHIQSDRGDWHLVHSDGGTQVHYDRNQAHLPNCPEVHTTLSADPFVASLPPGKYTFRVERGKEYLPLVREIEITNEPLTLEFRLQRWINMSEEGWYSGDTHVHRTIDELPNVMLAEDLNVAFPLTYWVTKSGLPSTNANGDAKYVDGGLIAVDPTHVIQPINSEYEIFTVAGRKRTLGAVLALNHRKPFSVGVPPVGKLARQARQQGALLDLDKHSWPWSLMLVPVMEIDLFQLSNNHVWQSGFGFNDWTIDKLPPFMNVEKTSEGFTEAGWLDFGFQTYYMMLNCGFRMRVSAGTASGVHPVPLGFSRVYVHLPDGFDYDQWVAGLDAGRSFVSNGPMLRTTFNGKPAGTTFRVDENKSANVSIKAQADSRRPLERIEVVVNGRVQHALQPSNRPLARGGYTSVVDHEIQFGESSWIVLRCFESHPDGRIRFAHTNPVFVDIKDKPLRPRKIEVNYLIRRMQEEIDLNGDVLNAGALQEYRQAMEIYQELAELAK